MKRLMQTTNDPMLTVLRVVLGVVMFAHGAQKLLGWFGGAGPSGTIQFMDQLFGVPAILTVLVIAAEFFGALGLIGGLFTRAAAGGIIAVMLGAIALVHAKVGFFMNWSGQQGGEGFEFHLLAIAIATVLLVRGAGWASLDRAIAGSGGHHASARPFTVSLKQPEEEVLSR